MDAARQRLLRDELTPFLVRNDARAYGAVVVDAGLYLVAASLAAVVEPSWLKGLLSLAAGMIPFYRLHNAQSHLAAILGADSIIETFGPRYLLSLMKQCKLYDYDRHQWQDYSGRSTSQTEGGLAVARGVD